MNAVSLLLATGDSFFSPEPVDVFMVLSHTLQVPKVNVAPP